MGRRAGTRTMSDPFWFGGMRVAVARDPAHFAERYGLIIIIALGESMVAIGIGAAGSP